MTPDRRRMPGQESFFCREGVFWARFSREIPTIDIFLDSAKHGFYISIDTVHPSMLLG